MMRLAFSLMLLVPLALRGQTPLGDFSSYDISGRTCRIHAGAQAVHLTFYRAEILRIDYLPAAGSAADSSYTVIRDDGAAIVPEILETDSTLEVRSTAIRALIRKVPLRFSFSGLSAEFRLEEPLSSGLSAGPVERNAAFQLPPGTHFYGTGERGFDLRGHAFDSYNTQNFNYSSDTLTMGINIPFLATSNGYALFFDNIYRGRFDLGRADNSHFSYTAFGGELTYYLIGGETVEKQLELYTWLTGRQPLPPRWAFGYIQSKFGYGSEAEARSVVQMIRSRGIPCDAIVLDLYWFNAMGDLAWNLASWPSPHQMMSDFLGAGIKTVAISEPYVTQGAATFAEGTALGAFARTTAGATYLLDNWWSCSCPAALVDFTSPSARSWWWSKYPPFMGSSMAGLWTDLGEPERHPPDMQHAGGPASKVHNIYNLLWAQTVAEGFASARPDERLFNLTRAGYAGTQRYGVITWSGDVSKTWEGFNAQLPMMLNMGLSGLPYHSSDLGGFCCGTTPSDLYLRWLALGVFSPIMRAHGVGGPTEPWGFDPWVEDCARDLIRLRYRLLPYLYTLARENFDTGKPLLRPLFFQTALFPGLTSSYTLGEALLLAPVAGGGFTTKTIEAPPGTWVDFWTDTSYEGGGTVTVAAPFDRPPFLIRAGSILPLAMPMNFSDEHPLDTLTLAIYPYRGAPGSFSLYEDDGKTLAYQRGEYCFTKIHHSTTMAGASATLTLVTEPSQGTYPGQLAHRTYIAEMHGVGGKPGAVRVNGVAVPERSSLTALRADGDGFLFEPAARRLCVQASTATNIACTVTVEQIELSTGEKQPALPAAFALEQNYPNPFNPSTVFSYQLPSAVEVTLEVFDVLGRSVALLVHRTQGPGSYRCRWEAAQMASGVYFYRLRAGEFVKTMKMVVQK